MPTLLSDFPRTGFNDLSIPGSQLTADSRSKVMSQTLPTIATAAGTTEVLFIVPFDGTITSVRYVFKDALAAHDTNYAEFAVINKGTNGAGTANVLAASTGGVNTTKVTGGTALAAYVQRTPTLASAGGVAVLKFQVLAAQVIANGTLANTLTEGRVQVNLLVNS